LSSFFLVFRHFETKITFLYLLIKETMTWKLKDEFKGHKPINFNVSLDTLSQKQILALKEARRTLYFENTKKDVKEKIKSFKTKKIEKIEDL
jgi:hypothetical protein